MHLIAKDGVNPNVNYVSFGAPMSEDTVKEIFDIGDKDIIQHKGDYVSNPLNIFNPKNWDERGHSMEDYAKSYHERKGLE